MKNKVCYFFIMFVCLAISSFANEQTLASDNLVIIGRGVLQCEDGDLFLDVDGNRYEFSKRTRSLMGNVKDGNVPMMDAVGFSRKAKAGLEVTCFGFSNLPKSVYGFVAGYVNKKEDIMDYLLSQSDDSRCSSCTRNSDDPLLKAYNEWCADCDSSSGGEAQLIDNSDALVRELRDSNQGEDSPGFVVFAVIMVIVAALGLGIPGDGDYPE